MNRKYTERIEVRLTKEDKKNILMKAMHANGNISSYVRRVLLNHEVVYKNDYEHSLRLIKLHKDLNRLGNLFKFSINALEKKIDNNKDIKDTINKLVVIENSILEQIELLEKFIIESNK